MMEWKYFHGKNPYKFIMDKKSSIDIDDALDLECAKTYLNLIS
jgi:N-acylneuraminate cytidylyltransferase